MTSALLISSPLISNAINARKVTESCLDQIDARDARVLTLRTASSAEALKRLKLVLTDSSSAQTERDASEPARSMST